MPIFITIKAEFSITHLKTDRDGVTLVALCLPVVFFGRTEFLKYQDRERLTDRASYFYAEQFKPTFLIWYLLIPIEVKHLGRKLSKTQQSCSFN